MKDKIPLTFERGPDWDLGIGFSVNFLILVIRLFFFKETCS